MSRSPSGERGLKYHHVCRVAGGFDCRSPSGERGLKGIASQVRNDTT